LTTVPYGSDVRWQGWLVLLALVAGCSYANDGSDDDDVAGSVTSAPATTTSTSATGAPWGDTVDGLLTFRGNPTRTYYGRGPMPSAPEILWRFPEEGGMCGESTVSGETTTWCGTGWTGQPAIFERDGRSWLTFGAYDHNVHFLDAATGDRMLPDLPTGDIIKGSVTIDPDGFPLLYTGSRDGFYRVVAFDRPTPEVLWELSAEAVSPTLWNDDWDGAGLVLDDHLVLGGENSQLHVVKLQRAYAPDGQVTVEPRLVFNTPGWDDELLDAIGDENVSIESSVAVSERTVYFANSGGLVQGWDLGPLFDATGPPTRVFRFWTGDDTDATVVIDDEGMLYVASEWERHTDRSAEVGQLMKLDPTNPDDPVVWSVDDQGASVAGFWATPALYGDLVVAATNGGEVLGLDRATGAERWRFDLPGPTWQSPVVVDDVLVQGDCDGVLHGFDVSDPNRPPEELWQVELEGCIESTPAVWDGRLYVGARGGAFYAIGDAAG